MTAKSSLTVVQIMRAKFEL